VATAVFFHAHPDDEAISTGGVMAKYSAAGHRVIVVFGTRGEHGEVDDGFLPDGEALGERREKEAREAARILGAHRCEFLGYVDSGMMGTPENDAPNAFWQADVEEAAGQLADILREENAAVLVAYDDHGLYGHPDHIQVHRVGVRAAELAGTPVVYEYTVDRDYLIGLMRQGRQDDLPDENPVFDESFGSPAELVTTVVNVRDFLEQKRAAMAAHASQIAETSFFLSMPDEMYAATWGQEWFIRRGAPAGTKETELEGLASS
jgi:LmbE family N-acetylglucosaminyl deacetylase